jgi:hypothetical protein
VKRRVIQRGPGQQLVDGANFRLMDEVRYVQDRAAEHDSRVVTLPQLLLFSTQTGTPGCSTLPSIWPFRWPAMEIPCRCTSRRRRRTLPLAGREPTASTARPSSTLRQSLGVSALFSATQYGPSSSRQDPKIFKYLWLGFDWSNKWKVFLYA